MASNKEMRRLAREAQSKGCDVSRTARGHFLIVAPSGDKMRMSFSPGSSGSEAASVRNYRKFMERNRL